MPMSYLCIVDLRVKIYAPTGEADFSIKMRQRNTLNTRWRRLLEWDACKGKK